MNNLSSSNGLSAPPTKPLRFGVIGLGWVSQHCHLPSMRMLKARGWPIEKVVVCDRVDARVQNATALWPDAEFERDPIALLERPDLDGVLILTHPDSSPGLLRQAIQRRKTVFVEKPVAPTRDEIRSCATLARNHQVKVQVGYNRRHQPLASEYFQLLKGLGAGFHVKVRFWRAQRREPGFFDDTLVHCLDFLSQQMGELEVKGIQIWPASLDTMALDQGWRVDLAAVHSSLLTAEVDIRPAVGRDLESYTAVGQKRSITLQYPHLAAVDGQAALTLYSEGKEQVLSCVRMNANDIEGRCLHSGFLHQMAEFSDLCAGVRAVPTCGLGEAEDALRLRDAIAAMARKIPGAGHQNGFPDNRPKVG